MDVSKLEKLANELFVDNVMLVKGKYTFPLNIDNLHVDSVAEEVENIPKKKKKSKKRRYDSGVPFAEAIGREGGIVKATFGFTLDRETYLQRVEEFNAEFGDYVRVEIMGDGNLAQPVVKFKENPERLAAMLVELGKVNGLEVEARLGPITYTVSRPDSPNDYVNLCLPSHLGRLSVPETFDPQRHKDAPTMMVAYLAPKLSIPLMKMYLSAQGG